MFEDMRDELNRLRVIEEQRVIKRKADAWANRVPGLKVNMSQEFNHCYPGAVALFLSRETEAGEERLWTGFHFASQAIVRAEEIIRRWEVRT